MKTTYASWTSIAGNPIAAARLGFVAMTVQMVNDGTAGQLDPGDQIILNFNQAVDTTTGPAASQTICANDTSGAI